MYWVWMALSAGVMIRNLTVATINRYIEIMGCYFAEGRSTMAQEVHSLDKVVDGYAPQAHRPGSTPAKAGSQSVTAVETTTYNQLEASVVFQHPNQRDAMVHTVPKHSKHWPCGEVVKKGVDNKHRWTTRIGGHHLELMVYGSVCIRGPGGHCSQRCA